MNVRMHVLYAIARRPPRRRTDDNLHSFGTLQLERSVPFCNLEMWNIANILYPCVSPFPIYETSALISNSGNVFA